MIKLAKKDVSRKFGILILPLLFFPVKAPPDGVTFLLQDISC